MLSQLLFSSPGRTGRLLLSRDTLPIRMPDPPSLLCCKSLSFEEQENVFTSICFHRSLWISFSHLTIFVCLLISDGNALCSSLGEEVSLGWGREGHQHAQLLWELIAQSHLLEFPVESLRSSKFRGNIFSSLLLSTWMDILYLLKLTMWTRGHTLKGRMLGLFSTRNNYNSKEYLWDLSDQFGMLILYCPGLPERLVKSNQMTWTLSHSLSNAMYFVHVLTDPWGWSMN